MQTRALTAIVDQRVGPVVSVEKNGVQVTVGGDEWHTLHIADHEVLHERPPHAERTRCTDTT